MKITLDMLREKGACESGLREFEARYPDGVDYQELLDACAEENVEYGLWLMDHFGALDKTLQVDEIKDRQNVLFAGRIVAAGSIVVDGILRTGKGIEAGWGIKAGNGIEAGKGIKAGEDYGIYAGLRVALSAKQKLAVITAKTKPKNIICGEWKEVCSL